MDTINIGPVNLQVDMEELVQNLHMSLNREEIFDLIKKLDLSMAEYDFTEKLYNYFSEEIQKETVLNEETGGGHDGN